MSELVKRNGSDLHLTGDIPILGYKVSIIPASETIYKEEGISDLKTILGEEK